jgi:hypothetical protein
MAYKMKPLPEGVTLEELFKHKSSAYRQAARVFFNGHEVSARDLNGMTGMSMGSIWATVKAFRDRGLIYVTKWIKPGAGVTNPVPLYRAGNKPDAPKPKPKDPNQVARNRKHVEAKKAAQEQQLYQWQGLAEALVPKRSKEEIQEINRLYLNWISEGVYG